MKYATLVNHRYSGYIYDTAKEAVMANEKEIKELKEYTATNPHVPLVIGVYTTIGVDDFTKSKFFEMINLNTPPFPNERQAEIHQHLLNGDLVWEKKDPNGGDWMWKVHNSENPQEAGSSSLSFWNYVNLVLRGSPYHNMDVPFLFHK